MENLVAKIKAELNVFVENADAQVEKGNKAAGARARKAALDALAAAPGLDVDCQVESVVGGKQRRLVTGIEVAADVTAAVDAATVLIFMTPQTAYEEILTASARSLRNDQIILLCPGGLGGALLVARMAAKAGWALPEPGRRIMATSSISPSRWG